MAKIIATKNPELLKDTLQKNNKELIDIWSWHAPAIFLNNRSGIVAEQIYNGTKGLMESFLWIDKSAQRKMDELIRDAIARGDTDILLDTPPDYVMMTLADIKTHKTRSKNTLTEDFN